VIAAALLAIATHIQVLPALDRDYDVTGAILYAEPNPTTRYTVSITHSDVKGYAVKIGAKFRF
jgi:hypothetical protein